jgi:hypothetical protein
MPLLYPKTPISAAPVSQIGRLRLIALGVCYPGANCTTDHVFGFVLYGMSQSAWASFASPVTVSAFDGTTGFEIHSSLSTTLGTSHNLMGQSFDFDRDGYDDILIGAGGATGAPITQYGAIYVVYGRPRSYWSASLTGTSPAFLDLAAELNTANDSSHCNSAITCATEFYYTNSHLDYGYNNALFGADLKGGSSNPYDIVTGGYYSAAPTVVYGGTRYPSTFDLSTLNTSEGFSVQTATCCNGLPSWYGSVSGVAVADVNGDGRNDLLLTTANLGGLYINGRRTPGAVLVYEQPAGGWSSVLTSDVLDYYSFKWDGTDSFMIEGPKDNSSCGWASSPFVADVRYGDKGAPEIMVYCSTGEPGHSAVYGLYKNHGWPSSIDLNQLN